MEEEPALDQPLQKQQEQCAADQPQPESSAVVQQSGASEKQPEQSVDQGTVGQAEENRDATQLPGQEPEQQKKEEGRSRPVAKKRANPHEGEDFETEIQPQIPFAHLGKCHQCFREEVTVYGCFKNLKKTMCDVRYCFMCLLHVYKVNVTITIMEESQWCCPYKQHKCLCDYCSGKSPNKRKPLSNEELDALFSHNVKKIRHGKSQSNPSTQQHQLFKQFQLMKSQSLTSTAPLSKNTKENQHMTKIQLKSKIKRLIEFNGQLIAKMSQNMASISEEESVFYNRLIYNNLKVLANLSEKLTLRGRHFQEQ